MRIIQVFLGATTKVLHHKAAVHDGVSSNEVKMLLKDMYTKTSMKSWRAEEEITKLWFRFPSFRLIYCCRQYRQRASGTVEIVESYVRLNSSHQSCITD